MSPDLSVIIPTFNRADMLEDVLEGLSRQTPGGPDFEVVVLDDGSTDDTAQLATAAAAKDPRVRYVYQDNGGLNVARNHGAREARSDLLVYLDDDVFLPPDFTAQMAAAFRSEWRPAAIAGRIRLRFEVDPPPWLRGNLRLYLSELDRGDNVEVLAPPEYPRGACFGVRRQVVDALGGFAVGLDRRGTSLISSGEQEFFLRVHAEGERIVYWPGAAVQHRVPPERTTLDYFLRRAKAQGASDALLHGDHRTPRHLLREGGRALRIVPIFAKALATRSGLIAPRLWLAYSAGRLRQTWKSQR